MTRTRVALLAVLTALTVALVPATAVADDTPDELRPYLKLRKNHVSRITYGGHVTLHTEASGAIRLLHRVVCDRDEACLVAEVRRVIDPLLADLTPKQREQFTKYFEQATAAKQYGDISRAIDEYGRNGGCIDIHIRTGVNWSQVKRGQHCKAGRAFSILSKDLELPAPLTGKSLFKATIGRRAYVTVYEQATAQLLADVSQCLGRGPSTTSYCATQTFARLAEQGNVDVRTVNTVLRAAVDQPDDSGSALLSTDGGCLTLKVGPTRDPFEWYRRNKSHRDCRAGDPFIG